jgi:hypothetical protein
MEDRERRRREGDQANGIVDGDARPIKLSSPSFKVDGTLIGMVTLLEGRELMDRVLSDPVLLGCDALGHE